MIEYVGGVRDPDTGLLYVYGTINGHDDVGLRLLVNTGTPAFVVIPHSRALELGVDIVPDPRVANSGTAVLESLQLAGQLAGFRDPNGAHCPIVLGSVPATIVPDEAFRLGFEGMLGLMALETLSDVGFRGGRLIVRIP